MKLAIVTLPFLVSCTHSLESPALSDCLLYFSLTELSIIERALVFPETPDALAIT